jgi:tetratricopeptide (TPR) repeat protein
MRILRLLLVGLAVLLVIGVALWFSQPAAKTIEVDAAEVSEEEGARLVAHGLDIEPRDLAAAEALWDPEECQAARERLEAALPGGEDEGALCVLLSVISRRLGDTEASFDYGLRGVELLPTVGRAHHVYSRAIAMKMAGGNPLVAIRNMKPWREELRTAIELDPTNLDARGEEFFFYAFVPAGMGGDQDRALELAAEVEAIDAPLGASLRARVFGRTDRRDEAIALCEATLEAHPGDARVLLALGGMHEATEAWSTADAAFARGSKAPDDVDGWRLVFKRAHLRTTEGRLSGEPELALELLDRFLAGAPRADMMPGPADVNRRRGYALEELGRVAEACAAYEAALEAKPDHEASREALDRLGPTGG